jgi:23S rRNA (adenine2503-C2)-methyltransferase
MDSYRGASWHTLCVSSQIGCRMGCTFCETGRMGLLRNLSPAEIVMQRVAARRLMQERYGVTDAPYSYFRDGIQNIVFMGMGEPLDNLANVIQAIRVLTEQNGMAVPYTQITVSTVGRLDGLRELAALVRREPPWRNLRLAVSLNAPTDALRDEIMPINKGMPLAELQQALLSLPLAPRSRLMIEYVLLRDVNDSVAHADRVAEWCRPLPCVVNLIPYNPQRDAAYAAPADDTVTAFLRRLRANGIFAKWRVTQGRNLMGACGQLGNAALRRRDSASVPL